MGSVKALDVVLPISHPQLGCPDARYVYRDSYGKPLVAVFRYEAGAKAPNGAKSQKKEFRPYDVVRGEWKAPEVRPLYRLDALACTPGPVVLVEGEKCSDVLNDLGVLATTAFGGCNGVAKTDLSPLKGRDVVIWPDADEAGEKYLHALGERLQAVAVSSLAYIPQSGLIEVLATVSGESISALPKGWDAADAVQAGFAKADIAALVKDARPYAPSLVQSNAPGAPLGLFGAPPPTVAYEWQEPDLSVLNPRTKPPELPLCLFGPFWSKWIAGKAEGCGAPVDYVAGSVLTASSVLIGNSTRIMPWEGWSEPAFLWMALVGNPSSGKSPAMDPVVSLLRKIESEKRAETDEQAGQYEADVLAANHMRRQWEKDVEEAVKSGYPAPKMPDGAREPDKPQAPRLMVADTTPEALARLLVNQPKGLLVQRDELAAWIGNFNRYAGGQGGDRAFWLEAFGARSFTIDRARNGGESVTIPYMGASIIGGIQPDRLCSLLMSGDDDGLTARFLYVWPDALPPMRPKAVMGDAEAYEAFKWLDGLSLQQQAEGGLKPGVVMLSDAAADCFQAWRELHVRDEPEGALSSWWGKMPGMVLRLALVLEMLHAARFTRIIPHEVSKVVLEGAIELVDTYFKQMARRCYGDASLPQAEKGAATLAKWIKVNRPDRINVREMYRSVKLAGLDRPEKVRDALAVLEEADWVRSINQATGGRKKQDWEVNPALL